MNPTTPEQVQQHQARMAELRRQFLAHWETDRLPQMSTKTRLEVFIAMQAAWEDWKRNHESPEQQRKHQDNES